MATRPPAESSRLTGVGASSGQSFHQRHLAAWIRDFSGDRAAFSPLKFLLPIHLPLFRTEIGGIDLRLYFHRCGRKPAWGKSSSITHRAYEEGPTKIEKDLQNALFLVNTSQSGSVRSHADSLLRRGEGSQPWGTV